MFLKIRYKIIDIVQSLYPRLCWADLVMWALKCSGKTERRNSSNIFELIRFIKDDDIDRIDNCQYCDPLCSSGMFRVTQ